MGRRSKYAAQSVVLDGITFDSKREARRWAELRFLERAGEISDLRRQVPISLQGQEGPILTPTGRPMRYAADFVYFDNRAGCEVIEDAKGFPTQAYKIKRAIVAAMGLEIRET